VTRQVTLSNHGDAPVTVDLSATVRGRNGTPVPDAVTFDPAQVTVPAGGSVSVAATYHPVADTEGGFTGRLTATAGGQPVLQTALAAYQAPQTHVLRLTPIPPEGWPTFIDVEVWVLVRVDAPQEPIVVGRALPFVDVVVPDGVYSVSTSFGFHDAGTGDLTTAVLVDPEVVVDGADTELVIDGNTASPLRVETPLPSELRDIRHAVVRRNTDGESFAVFYSAEWRHERAAMRVTPTEPVTLGEVEFVTAVAAPQLALSLRTTGPDGREIHANWGHSYFQQPRLGGEYTVDLVSVGSGTAEEIAGVEVAGRLALVELDTPYNTINAFAGQLYEAQQRLAAAGALAVVAFQPERSPYWCAQG